jgi:hypothetical protein
VSAVGVWPLLGKLKTLEEYKRPKDEKGLSRFLSIINYYHRFIRECTELTRKVNGKRFAANDMESLDGPNSLDRECRGRI